MVYGRKRTTRVYKRKAYPRKTKVTRGVVKRVKRIEKELTQKRISMYTTSNGQDLQVGIQSPYTVQRLCNFVNDGAIFGTDPNDLLGSKVMLKSMTCKCDVGLQSPPNDEEETQNIEFYCVSLKDEANDILDKTTGQLSILTPNVHYYQYSGYTYLNHKYFNVHKHKRMMLTNYGTALTSSGAQNLDGTNQRIDFKLKINKIIKAPMTNTANQAWKDLICPRDPSSNYYLIWFNDNSVLDTESPLVKSLVLKKFEKLDN